MRLITILILMILSSTLKAQRDIDFGKYRAALKGESKWTVGFAGNRSVADGEPVRFFGLYVGKDYDDLLRLALGIQFLNPMLHEQEIRSQGALPDTIRRTTEMAYWFFRSEFTYYRTEKWKLTLPVSIGLGSVKRMETRTNWSKARMRENATAPLEFGTHAIYFINPWLGLKAGLGIRLALGKESFSTFSAPYYKLGIGLYPVELYKLIRDRKND